MDGSKDQKRLKPESFDQAWILMMDLKMTRVTRLSLTYSSYEGGLVRAVPNYSLYLFNHSVYLLWKSSLTMWGLAQLPTNTASPFSCAGSPSLCVRLENLGAAAMSY